MWCARQEQNAVSEGYVLIFLNGVVQRLRLGIEDMLSKRIGGKQAVAARVPIGRVIGVSRMIKDRDGDGVAFCIAG
jgi:hypothetical protein